MNAAAAEVTAPERIFRLDVPQSTLVELMAATSAYLTCIRSNILFARQQISACEASGMPALANRWRESLARHEAELKKAEPLQALLLNAKAVP